MSEVQLSPDQIVEALPKYLIPEKAGTTKATIVFDLSGENAGKWWVKIHDGAAESGKGDPPETPNLTLQAEVDHHGFACLEHAVKLEVLPGRDSQGAVGPAPADVVVRDVRVGRDNAPWNPGPDHKLVVLIEALGPRLLPAVAVVLLIDAVKLQQLLRVVPECRRVFEELFLDEPAKMVAGRLDGFVPRQSVEWRAVG